MSSFSTFYNVSIPEPVLNDQLEQLAQIKGPHDLLEIYWMPKTKQIIAWDGLGWWIQPNGLISHSLAVLMDCREWSIITEEIHLFDRDYKNGERAPEDMERKFLECEWSDYACDKMRFQAFLDVDVGSD